MNGFEGRPPVRFAARQLRKAYGEKGVACAFSLEQDGRLPPGGYRAFSDEKGFRIRAGDEEGAMTALLDLRDSVLAESRAYLKPGLHLPYIRRRGIKLNVPLDARTPSYSDCGDSAQLNIAAMWREEFWRGLLDRMALNRYNTLTLWNLCPFPSMVRTPEYPRAALEDVMVSSAMAGGTSRGMGFYTPEMRENLVRIRKMTIDEKTAFWNRVLRYAADRCVKVYLFTWNLYLYGLEDSGYSLTERADDPETARYIRCSVAALLRAFPLLAGIGVTAGENLCAEWTENQDMRWVRETYGRGIEDVLEKEPGREITLICRTHMTTVGQLKEAFAGWGGKLEISAKYAMAHMTAAEKPHFSDGLIREKPPGMGLWLTLRQDDFYLFPWADDRFLESFVRGLPREDLQGFYFGSDGVIWGLEAQSRTPGLQGRYWVDKHFLAFAMMGRLGQKGRLSENEKRALCAEWMPELPPDRLLGKIRLASHAVRLVSLAHWRNYDLQWYPEACCLLNEPDRTLVYDDLNSFLRSCAFPNARVASAADTAAGKGGFSEDACSVAGRMLRLAARADAVPLPWAEGDGARELCADLERITHLARFYAWKLRAAVALKQGRDGAGEAAFSKARSAMKRAAAHWRVYADETAKWYRPQRLSRLRGVVSPDMWDERVRRDVEICEDRREQACLQKSTR